MENLTPLLELSAARHNHLCPRQVLGVRMGLAGADHLDLRAPVQGKRLIIIAETDGCFVDGLDVATGCNVGHRTMRIVDYGKVAATFVDKQSERAVRLAPQRDIREKAIQHSPDISKKYFAQLESYKTMPAEGMFTFQLVKLQQPISNFVSRAGVRINCSRCGEEIINEREIAKGGKAFCRSCAKEGYYSVLSTQATSPSSNGKRAS